MSKAVNRDQFPICDSIRIGVIAQTLKARAASGIVQVAEKDIELNELESIVSHMKRYYADSRTMPTRIFVTASINILM